MPSVGTFSLIVYLPRDYSLELTLLHRALIHCHPHASTHPASQMPRVMFTPWTSKYGLAMQLVRWIIASNLRLQVTHLSGRRINRINELNRCEGHQVLYRRIWIYYGESQGTVSLLNGDGLCVWSFTTSPDVALRHSCRH